MENLIKVLVVENEKNHAARLSKFLTELGYQVTSFLQEGEEVLLYIEKNVPTVALLGIQLGNIDGIELAKKIHGKHQIPIIFLTSENDDATFQKAKEASPFAILTKPFVKIALQRTLELAVHFLLKTPEQAQKTPEMGEHKSILLEDRIFVRYKDSMVKIMFSEILYVEAERNYCTIATKSKDFLLTMPMKYVEEKLPVAIFMRIHRSFVVNITEIDKITESQVVLGQKTIDLSKPNRSTLLNRVGLV